MSSAKESEGEGQQTLERDIVPRDWGKEAPTEEEEEEKNPSSEGAAPHKGPQKAFSTAGRVSNEAHSVI